MTATDDSGSENEANDFVRSSDRIIASMDRTIQILRESNAMLRENRAILVAIAEHLGVTIEEPDSGIQSV
ncbi:MAG: hypothetical protein OXG53_00040 [Chloroflexi bacterium]|nr:hypothetical protein [Chloroflexota bacterium]